MISYCWNHSNHEPCLRPIWKNSIKNSWWILAKICHSSQVKNNFIFLTIFHIAYSKLDTEFFFWMLTLIAPVMIYILLRQYIVEGIRFMSMYLLYFIHTYMPDTIKMTYEYFISIDRFNFIPYWYGCINEIQVYLLHLYSTKFENIGQSRHLQTDLKKCILVIKIHWKL